MLPAAVAAAPARPRNATMRHLQVCRSELGLHRCFAACRHHQPAARCVATAAASGAPAKYAVVGAGLAGIATAWHILKQCEGNCRPVSVVVFDAVGIAAGGSGSAAGLVHPFSPKGKLLWNGAEAFQDAMDLVGIASQQAEQDLEQQQQQLDRTTVLNTLPNVAAVQPQPSTSSGAEPCGFVWRYGVLRPAANAKQGRELYRPRSKAQDALVRQAVSRQASRNVAGSPPSQGNSKTEVSAMHRSGSGSSSTVNGSVGDLETVGLSAEELQALIPGARIPTWLLEQAQQQQQQQQQQHEASSSNGHAAEGEGRGASQQPGKGSCAALYIPSGVVLDVPRYLEALWRACQVAAERRCDGSTASMVLGSKVSSLTALEEQHGPFDAVVVAAGAAAGTIKEVVDAKVPLRICQGYTLVLRPSDGSNAAPPSNTCSSRSSSSSQVENTPSQEAITAASTAPKVTATATAAAHPVTAAAMPGSAPLYPAGAPSLLGQLYMAAHGPSRLVAGASRSYGWSPEEALLVCQPEFRSFRPRSDAPGMGLLQAPATGGGEEAVVGARLAQETPEAVAAAAAELHRAGAAVWAPLQDWQVEEIKSGMRALPPRNTAGAVPLAGRLCEGRNWWLLAGLGARGLVYHAWLAQKVAAAAVHGDESSLLLPELQRWKAVAAGQVAAVFDEP